MAANSLTGLSPKVFLACGYSTLLAGFLLLALFPSKHDTDAARKDIVRIQDEIAARQAKSDMLGKLKRRVEFANLETRHYDRLVPANQDLGPFLTELSRELDKAGMTDISVQALPPTPLGRSVRLPIEIRGRGTFAQFHAFQVQLEHLQRMSSVGSLTIEADGEMNGNINVQLRLYIYNAKVGT